MASCGFSKLVGGSCGSSADNPTNVECVVLGTCAKDIEGHLYSYRVYGDPDLDSEAKLILARAGVFEISSFHRDLTICPRHRDLFGIRWRSNKKTCGAPSSWCSHTKLVKGERGINLSQAKQLFLSTNVLLPVASQICRQCRRKLEEELENSAEKIASAASNAVRPSSVETLTPTTATTGLAAAYLYEEIQECQSTEHIEATIDTIKELSGGEELQNAFQSLLIEEPSMYEPDSQESQESQNSSDDTQCGESKSIQRMKLNEFLRSCGTTTTIGPYKKTWVEASERTKMGHVTKAKTLVVAGLDIIAPGDVSYLWEALRDSGVVERELGIAGESPEEQKYLNALAESYQNASSWETRRQVLSIMADVVTYKRIQHYIPGLTEYRFKMARQHALRHGRGAEVPSTKSPRLRIELMQLDHFLAYITSPHVTQDLPFGQRYLRLSNGHVLETPNVIRTIIPSRLVRQYKLYCEETGFKPFGAATMLRILSACSATTRKSLQGLDSTAAAGAKGFDDLSAMVESLKEKGLSKNTAKAWERTLKESKQYLKSDFKVHVSDDSSVADHCIFYALSDVNDKTWKTPCKHVHDKSCPQCEELRKVLEDIGNFLRDQAGLSQEELQDLEYAYKQSTEAIAAWKAHQLRSVRQDQARTDCLNKLDEASVLIIQDWAMKFLPIKYRESQSDWFGKRGISWHISVVARKVDGHLESQSFVHIAEKCTQDTLAVVRLLEHTLRSLKSEHPEITRTAYIRQDNAGCYHSSLMIASCCLMKKRTGISICRADFSDPQGGKGACDRKAASIKAHVRRYINEGHDVQSAQDLRDAILSEGGLKGVRVALVDADDAKLKSEVPPVKLAGISFLNNFEYSDKGVKVWKAFEVGKGKLIKQSEIKVLDYLKTCSFQSNFSTGNFFSVSKESSSKRRDQQPKVAEQDNSPAGGELLTCPNEGCVKMYQRHSSLEKHLSFGKCKMMPERDSLLDSARKRYHLLLTEGADSVISSSSVEQGETSATTSLPEGWALKTNRKAAWFSDAQRQYLEEKFNLGQVTGQKQDPNAVSRDMRFARKLDGTKLFTSDEYLSPQQVQSFFSRTAAKVRNTEYSEADQVAAQEEKLYDELRQDILDEVGLCHPIVYDNLNLCAMAKGNRLTQLSIAMLSTICEFFDLPTEGFNNKRKKEYIEALHQLILACDLHVITK